MRNILRSTLLLASVLALAPMSFSQICNGNAKKGTDNCTNTQGGASCKLASKTGTCKYNNNNYCTCFLPSFTVAFKDINVPGATETDTYGINNKRVIVGDYVDAQGNQHGLILSGTTVKKVDIPGCFPGAGSTSTAFYGINSNNIAAGWCTTNNGIEVGFTYNAANGKVRRSRYPAPPVCKQPGSTTRTLWWARTLTQPKRNMGSWPPVRKSRSLTCPAWSPPLRGASTIATG
jgi:hypothetical protein